MSEIDIHSLEGLPPCVVSEIVKKLTHEELFALLRAGSVAIFDYVRSPYYVDPTPKLVPTDKPVHISNAPDRVAILATVLTQQVGTTSWCSGRDDCEYIVIDKSHPLHQVGHDFYLLNDKQTTPLYYFDYKDIDADLEDMVMDVLDAPHS